MTKYQGRPFALVGVNADADRDEAQAGIAKHQLTWRSFWAGDSNVMDAYGVSFLPAFIVLDGRGIVRYKLEGDQVHRLEPIIEQLLREL